MRLPSLSAALVGILTSSALASPWGSRVVSYDPGAAVGSPYTDPASALGSPTRYTGIGSFPGAVTPFNPAFGENEIVSIGAGGHLTLELAQPARDDARNPFGVDLLIFGNAGYIDMNFPVGVVGPLFGGSRGAILELSADGVRWETVAGVEPDGALPTLGYADLTNPYSLARGRVRTSFTTPVDPAFDPSGRTFAEVVAGYAGAGGGVGIDLALTGLVRAAYVRISLPFSATGTADIDAIAKVRAIPAPGAGLIIAIAPLFAPRRRGARTKP